MKPLVVIPLLSHLCQPWHEGVERNWAPRDPGAHPPPPPGAPAPQVGAHALPRAVGETPAGK